jgi:hypothetical protein
MANSISQNPRNKAGRNSGAGPGGYRLVTPSEAEKRRGLRPFEVDEPARWPLALGMGLGVLAMVGGGIVALAMRRAERSRSVRGRLENLVPWR